MKGISETMGYLKKKKKVIIISLQSLEENDRRTEKILKEIVTENFPNLAKDINLQIQEIKSQKRQAQRNPLQNMQQLNF